MKNDALAKLDAATRALAEAKGLDEVKKIHDIAKAAAIYARAAQLGMEAQNHAAEVKLRAERKAGELLERLERDEPGRPKKLSNVGQLSEFNQVLNDTATSKQDASRWQKIAAMPEDKFEEVIGEAKEKKAELTTALMLKEAHALCPSVHFSSQSSEWTTPEIIIKKTIGLFDRIDLDPCSNPDFPNIPANQHFTKEQDALKQPWRGKVYMNPPYGRVIDDWINYLCEQFESDNTTEAIALVPSRTDTRWFRRMRGFPRCFVWGRLKFGESENSAPFPSMVIYLGKNVKDFFKAFSDIGDIYIWMDE